MSWDEYFPEPPFAGSKLFRDQKDTDDMPKQFIVCLDRTVEHLDTTYGPFPSIDAAEEWLKGHGFHDEIPAGTWPFILELQPELDQDFIEGLAADKKANAELLQR